MFLKIILAVVYYIGGTLIAVFGAMCLGFILAAFIALTNIVAYKWTWLQLLGYLLGAALCLGLIQLALLGAGTLGDHTNYKMQTMLIVGAVFPGVFMLKVVPAYARMAARYARGNFDDTGI